jgi:uncharacterized protein YjbI with pentapeptide repeats
MTNDEHLVLLKKGVVVWNDWRERHPHIRPELSGANLSQMDLGGVDLSKADLTQVDLSRVQLNGADLVRTELSGATLSGADLRAADLTDANLSGASLAGAILTGADLNRTNFSEVALLETILSDLDLRNTLALDKCNHLGPSIIDFRTLAQSENLPLSFLRGCGLPEPLIEYLSSLSGTAIHFYSCFISHSSKDGVFADRIHADLQNKGVRCWFAPHDLAIGAKTWDAIDQQIRLRDKLLIILSKASIGSDWVEDEVNKAFAEERSRKENVLFPIRIDNSVMTTTEPWAIKLREQRNIGDFRQWKSPTEYRKSLERLLRDLKSSVGGGATFEA